MTRRARASKLSLLVLGGLLTTQAAAQESCDVETKLVTRESIKRFVQILRCGDADLTNAYDCQAGGGPIHVVLPIPPFEARPGDRFDASFEYNGQIEKRGLVVVEAVPEGAGDPGAAMDLDRSERLWKALSTPGLDIYASDGNATTDVGAVHAASKKLKQFKAACGL